MRARVVFLVLLLGLAAPGCGGPAVDLKQALQLEVVSSGWLHVGIVNGQNKLVPALSIKLRNVSDQNLVSLQLNAVFHRVTEAKEWGTGFVTVAGSDGLMPGVTSASITV